MDNKHIGSKFDEFLKEDGIQTEVTTRALKKFLAWQIAEAMRKEGLSKAKMAARMKTSRSALDRLLDPGNTSVTLQTLDRAAFVLGKRLQVELVNEG